MEAAQKHDHRGATVALRRREETARVGVVISRAPLQVAVQGIERCGQGVFHRACSEVLNRGMRHTAFTGDYFEFALALSQFALDKLKAWVLSHNRILGPLVGFVKPALGRLHFLSFRHA